MHYHSFRGDLNLPWAKLTPFPHPSVGPVQGWDRAIGGFWLSGMTETQCCPILASSVSAECPKESLPWAMTSLRVGFPSEVPWTLGAVVTGMQGVPQLPAPLAQEEVDMKVGWTYRWGACTRLLGAPAGLSHLLSWVPTLVWKNPSRWDTLLWKTQILVTAIHFYNIFSLYDFPCTRNCHSVQNKRRILSCWELPLPTHSYWEMCNIYFLLWKVRSGFLAEKRDPSFAYWNSCHTSLSHQHIAGNRAECIELEQWNCFYDTCYLKMRKYWSSLAEWQWPQN